MKRIIAMLLVVLIAFCGVPMTDVYAAETGTNDTPGVTGGG